MAKTLDVGPAVGENGRGRNRGGLSQRSPGPEQEAEEMAVLHTGYRHLCGTREKPTGMCVCVGGGAANKNLRENKMLTHFFTSTE